MMRPRKTLAFLAALALAAAASASAITLRVTDRNLQELIAQGETQGGRLILYINSSASGPVTVFVRDGNNVVSYPAVIRNGQIILENPSGTPLAKFLAARGVTLSSEPVKTDAGRTFSLPGLDTASPAVPDVPGVAKGLLDSKGGNGKGKNNGKDKDDKSEKDEKDEKEHGKGKGKP